MRDILFRGKRCGNGEWVEGDLIHRSPGVYIRMMNGAQYQVNPDTVGQYTGIDVDGVKVFEGDIIRGKHIHRDYETVGKVKYYEDYFAINWGDELMPVSLAQWKRAEAKVIGNIHDNPELVEVDE